MGYGLFLISGNWKGKSRKCYVSIIAGGGWGCQGMGEYGSYIDGAVFAEKSNVIADVLRKA